MFNVYFVYFSWLHLVGKKNEDACRETWGLCCRAFCPIVAFPQACSPLWSLMMPEMMIISIATNISIIILLHLLITIIHTIIIIFMIIFIMLLLCRWECCIYWTLVAAAASLWESASKFPIIAAGTTTAMMVMVEVMMTMIIRILDFKLYCVVPSLPQLTGCDKEQWECKLWKCKIFQYIEENCESQQSSSPLSICWLALFSLGCLVVCSFVRLHGDISIYLHRMMF